MPGVVNALAVMAFIAFGSYQPAPELADQALHERRHLARHP
jgi:hypothetical protein